MNQNTALKLTSDKMEEATPTLLIIEDIAVVRVPIRSAFKKVGFKILEAESIEQAKLLSRENNISLITLDLHLPDGDGVTWLKHYRAEGNLTPVIIVSGSTAAEAEEIYGALTSGAQEFFEKDNLNNNIQSLVDVGKELTKERAGTSCSVSARAVEQLEKKMALTKLIVIGSNAGGKEAIWSLIRDLPKQCPPIVIAQNTTDILGDFFADSLTKLSGLKIADSNDGERLANGHIYLAKGFYDLKVEGPEGSLTLRHSPVPSGRGYGSSPNVLFASAAQLNVPTMGVVLSGIGSDGVSGLSALAESGWGYSFAQSVASSVAVELPKSAISRDTTHFIGSPKDIRSKMLSLLKN